MACTRAARYIIPRVDMCGRLPSYWSDYKKCILMSGAKAPEPRCGELTHPLFFFFTVIKLNFAMVGKTKLK